MRLFESEKHWCLGVTGWTSVWGWTAVKSSALEVIFRAREVLGWAEMFLICNSGAIHGDQYTDLSQTDCMMFCLAPQHPPEVHQPSSLDTFYFSRQSRASSLLSYFYFTSGLLLCYVLFILSLCLHTHTHVGAHTPTHTNTACVRA